MKFHKTKSLYFYLLLIFLSCNFIDVIAQDKRIDHISSELDSLSNTVSSLNDTVNISVNGANFQDFLRGLAIANSVNISIEPQLNFSIVNNFTNVKFKDVLVFLVKEYKLDIKIIGNIISVSKYLEPQPEKIVPKPKEPIILYKDSLLTLDLKSDSLSKVVKQISILSGVNIVLTPLVQDKKVSGYIQNSTVEDALYKLGIAHNFNIEKTKDNFFIVSEFEQANQQTNTSNRNVRRSNARQSDGDAEGYKLEINRIGESTFTIYANKAPLDSVFVKVSKMMGKDYNILSDLKKEVTFYFSEISYFDFLNYVFNGKEYTFRRIDNIIFVGEMKMNDLQETKVLQLQYRTVDEINKSLPKSIQEELEIIEFVELNSILVSGPSKQIEIFSNFIKELDRLVPVILIEVMIVESKKSSAISTGLSAGFGNAPNTTSTFISNSNTAPGGIDFSFNASEISSLLGSINGFSGVNIGRVSESFYLNISALETNGILKVRSTPKLSTLNGHEAQLTSGETTYYIDETRSLISTQSINETYTKQYKPVNADLKITIRPIVSGDNQITLDIDVSQSNFTAAIDPKGPPGTINRSFKSIIRVKDQEMILLGGLDKNYDNNTGSGIPILSKIPILKWLFSSRKKEDAYTKLNIFIKPTVIN